MVGRTVVGELDDLGAVRRRHAGDAEDLAAVLVADAVPCRPRRPAGPTGGRRCRCPRTGRPGRCRRWTCRRRRGPCRCCRCRIRYQPSPRSTSCQAWSLVPELLNCTTRALLSRDMPSTARTLPLCLFWIRRKGGSGGPGPAVRVGRGKAVMRSRAAPIGTRVTVSTGASLRAGPGCRGATTRSSSAIHCSMRRASAVMRTGTVSWVNGGCRLGEGGVVLLFCLGIVLVGGWGVGGFDECSGWGWGLVGGPPARCCPCLLRRGSGVLGPDDYGWTGLSGDRPVVACEGRPGRRSEAVVPRRGRVHLVLGEGVVAPRSASYRSPILRGVGEGAVLDADGVVLLGPVAQRRPLGETQGHPRRRRARFARRRPRRGRPTRPRTGR